MAIFEPAHKIRGSFSRLMSDMYRSEVPLYGTMLNVVASVNKEFLEKHPGLEKEIGSINRVGKERHGAIRLGLPEELRDMRRVFAVMGMEPVDYYDLTQATPPLPVHSTAFRPIDPEELGKNPFRVFTSLLQLENEYFFDKKTQEEAKAALKKRCIFTPKLMSLVEKHEKDGGLDKKDAKEFAKEAVKTFKWHKNAITTKEFYDKMREISDLAADIVCFKGPHINHLTPRVLDMDELYRRMRYDEGIAMIDKIQGPPQRKVPILLRQTSFRALDEDIIFPTEEDGKERGSHRARFGEIEARGIALTPKGRELYDKALAGETSFDSIPDDIDKLRKQSLAYFRYSLVDEAANRIPALGLSIEDLINSLIVKAIPITYEDFLPVSAAGIFRSNLREEGKKKDNDSLVSQGQAALEKALGRTLLNSFDLYEAEQQKSLDLLKGKVLLNHAS